MEKLILKCEGGDVEVDKYLWMAHSEFVRTAVDFKESQGSRKRKAPEEDPSTIDCSNLRSWVVVFINNEFQFRPVNMRCSVGWRELFVAVDFLGCKALRRVILHAIGAADAYFGFRKRAFSPTSAVSSYSTIYSSEEESQATPKDQAPPDSIDNCRAAYEIVQAELIAPDEFAMLMEQYWMTVKEDDTKKQRFDILPHRYRERAWEEVLRLFRGNGTNQPPMNSPLVYAAFGVPNHHILKQIYEEDGESFVTYRKGPFHKFLDRLWQYEQMVDQMAEHKDKGECIKWMKKLAN